MVWSGYAVLMSGKTDLIKLNNIPGCLPGSTFVYSEVFKLDFFFNFSSLFHLMHANVPACEPFFRLRISNEVDINKKTENQAKMTKLSMEWKRLCKIKAKVQKYQSQSQYRRISSQTEAGTEEYYWGRSLIYTNFLILHGFVSYS
ncbi:hypothetical protein Tco_0817903 [Tanacetum coccineum]